MSTDRFPETERLLERRFQDALERHAEGSYVFGLNLGIGTGTQDAIPEWVSPIYTILEESPEPATVLDIGAGDGSFLELLTETSRVGRAVGFTATNELRGRSPEGIEWVYGDFQRPETWSPGDVLKPASVDVAVSSMTFMHMPDRISALKNAMQLLKPGGHIFIDGLGLTIERDRGHKTARYIMGQLRKLGAEGLSIDGNLSPFMNGTDTLGMTRIHLRRGEKAPDFRKVIAKGSFQEDSDTVVYGRA